VSDAVPGLPCVTVNTGAGFMLTTGDFSPSGSCAQAEIAKIRNEETSSFLISQ
jgi:hypothetical protein